MYAHSEMLDQSVDIASKVRPSQCHHHTAILHGLEQSVSQSLPLTTSFYAGTKLQEVYVYVCE